MSRPRISQNLRDLVRQRAGRRCEYCQTAEWISGLECEIDHVIPVMQGGPTTADNLCLACSSCNGFKQAKTHGLDPDIGEKVDLFHPRQQHWYEHFHWSDDGVQILGSSGCGQATIAELRLNHPLIVVARTLWVRFGQHPPGSRGDAEEGS